MGLLKGGKVFCFKLMEIFIVSNWWKFSLFQIDGNFQSISFYSCILGDVLILEKMAQVQQDGACLSVPLLDFPSC